MAGSYNPNIPGVEQPIQHGEKALAWDVEEVRYASVGEPSRQSMAAAHPCRRITIHCALSRCPGRRFLRARSAV